MAKEFIPLADAIRRAEKSNAAFSAQAFRRYLRGAKCPIKKRRSSLAARAHYEVNAADFNKYIAALNK